MRVGPFSGPNGPEAAALEAPPLLDRRTLASYLHRLLGVTNEIGDDKFAVRWFSGGGIRLKARFTDAALADLYSSRLFPAEGVAFDARVDVVEASALNIPPPAAWADEGYQERLFDRQLERQGLKAVYPYQLGLWQVFEQNSRVALQFAGTRQDLPIWDFGAPLRLPFHWATLNRTRRLVHGAVLGEGGDGVLIVGPGGVGKSGTTLAGIYNGLQTVGDDYVVVEIGTPPVARPVYRMLKQDPQGIERIWDGDDRPNDRSLNWQGKVEFDPANWFPGCFADQMRIRAIVLPVLGHGASAALEPLPRGAAIEAVARSTIEQLPGERSSTILFFTGLASRLPAVRLFLSKDSIEIVNTIRELIRQLR